MSKISEPPSNRPLRLNNATCPYCGIELLGDNNTKEHVIGRRFVPRGFLNGSWNLIVRACRKCNELKSKLENDISAITLSGRFWFDVHDSEQLARQEAQRKARNSMSNRTRKSVLHSQEERTIEVTFAPGSTIKFDLVSPPQIDSDRLWELARMQMMAFFYFVTFNQEANRGGFWPEGFHPLSEAHHGDWGNSLQRAFMRAVVDWQPCLVGDTAAGYFRSIIRRHPTCECWSWAVEWNKNYRLVGFFGSREAAQETVHEFQAPRMTAIATRADSEIRFRNYDDLSDEEDSLFLWNEENT